MTITLMVNDTDDADNDNSNFDGDNWNHIKKIKVVSKQ